MNYSALQLPLVSVLIPAYNAERSIARTLQSVLMQTYSELEVIVVNDGSTDRTAAIVEQFAQRDPRVRLFRQSNAGVAAARNLALHQSRGEFVAPLDADDIWYPTHLSAQVDCFLRLPKSVGLVYSWSIDIDAEDRQLSGFHAAKITGNVYRTLLCHNFLGNASCALIRRSILDRVGGYSERFQAANAYGCEDWELYLRIAATCEFRVVPQFSVGYRRLPDSMSHNYERMAQSHALMLQIVQQKYAHLPTFLYQLSRSSLYLYFAQQCYTNHSDRATLHWLRAAVCADLSPLLRLGTYLLAIKSSLRLVRSAQVDLSAATLSDIPTKLPTKLPAAKLPSRRQIQFKILVGNTLHYSLSRLEAR